MFFPEYEPRIRTIEALRGALSGAGTATELTGAAEEIESLSQRLEPAVGATFSAYGELVRAAAHLHQ